MSLELEISTRADEADGRGSLRMTLRRIRNTTGAWCLLGVLVGLCLAGRADTLSIVSYVLAGLIVMAPVGLLLGMIGAQWKETLLCGLAGMGFGFLLPVLSVPVAAGQSAATGVIFAGLVGSTFVTVFFRLPRAILHRLTAQPESGASR